MSSSLRAHREELELVAGALTSAHKLQDLLDRQEQSTAAMQHEVREEVTKLASFLLVEKLLDHTGDPEGVGNTMHDILEEAFYRLAA
jgi:hypothetical protein